MEHSINIYITANCLISSLGFNTRENMEALRKYRSGIALQTDGRIADKALLAATIAPEKLAEATRKAHLKEGEYTRMEQLFILAIRDVLAQSGFSLKDNDCGLILSTTKGNIDLLQNKTSKDSTPSLKPDSRIFLSEMGTRIGNYFDCKQPVEIVSNACISGVSALIVAQRWMETGRYKRVVVAGGDLLSHFITSGFNSFKSLSENLCLPYDARRDGLNLGEACGAVLLTREGGDNDVVLCGGGISNDANHISGPSRTGDGLFFAIRQAMEEAGIESKDVSFVNAHGTATVYNDAMESKALALAGLESVPLNSLKPYFGHTLGASGIIETIVCLHELKEGILFGTLGYQKTDLPVPITVSASHQKRPMRCCVKTASGFGGCNAAIVLALSEHAKSPKHLRQRAKETMRLQTTARVSLTQCQWHLDKIPMPLPPVSNFAAFIREAYKALSESNLKFYKMDDLSKLGYVATGHLLKGRSFEPEKIGLILANAASSLDTDLRHQQLIENGADANASPSVFVYTLPNVVAGEICIRHKIQGETTFFIHPHYNEEKLEQYARIVMQKGNLKACIIGWCNLLGEDHNAEFKLIETI